MTAGTKDAEVARVRVRTSAWLGSDRKQHPTNPEGRMRTFRPLALRGAWPTIGGFTIFAAFLRASL